jgi:regulator of sigma E protease
LGLFYGSPVTKPIIGGIEKNYPAALSGLEKGDLILSVDGKKVISWDDVLVELELYKSGDILKFKVEKEDGSIKTIDVTPKKVEKGKEISYKVGISPLDKREYGLIPAIKYSFVKTGALFKTMFEVIKSLVTGDLGIKKLSGPVGIYEIVGASAKAGFDSVLYLIAFLSINIGFVNLLPVPAFDGGRLIFLIIEKIKGSPVNSKVENYIHAVGFIFLIGFFILITWNDITKMFN